MSACINGLKGIFFKADISKMINRQTIEKTSYDYSGMIKRMIRNRPFRTVY
jgi:hypothetical protein